MRQIIGGCDGGIIPKRFVDIVGAPFKLLVAQGSVCEQKVHTGSLVNCLCESFSSFEPFFFLEKRPSSVPCPLCLWRKTLVVPLLVFLRVFLWFRV